MAQWLGQFAWLNHQTKVLDTERSLRKAILAFKNSPVAEQSARSRTVRRLAGKLLSARLKALHARISALSEPGGRHMDCTAAAPLCRYAHEMELRGSDEVLREFGVLPNPE